MHKRGRLRDDQDRDERQEHPAHDERLPDDRTRAQSSHDDRREESRRHPEEAHHRPTRAAPLVHKADQTHGKACRTDYAKIPSRVSR